MNNVLKRCLALLCVVAMAVTMLPTAFAASEKGVDSTDFVVLSTTDLHGKCWNQNILNDTTENNNMLRMATAVSQIREEYGAENVVLVDNGDLYQGTPVSSYNISLLTQGLTTDMNPMALCLEYMDYDAAVLGNHEFNYAWDTMQTIRQHLQDNGVSSICANLYYEETGKNVFTPYVTKTIQVGGQDYKIGILGIENTDCTRWDVPDNYPGIIFASPENTSLSVAYEVNKYVPKMQAEGCDFIIVAYHSGLGSASGELEYGVNTENQVLRMITETTGVDMVIAGHDHSSGYSNNTYSNKDGEDVLVVNGGGTQLTESVWTVSVDEDGNFSVALSSSKNLSMGSYAEDETLKAIIQPYAVTASEYVNQECGKAIGEWDGKTNYYLTQTDTIDLINRAQIAEGTKHLAEKYDTDEKKNELYAQTGLDHLSVDVSSTSVVATKAVSAGTISMKTIYQYYKYDNTLYLLPMTGQQIKDVLEYNAANRLKATVRNGAVSYSTTGDNFTNPVFYGLDFEYDMYQPAGSRVVISGFADGRAFELDKTYIIAINNYHLGNGPFADYSPDDAIWSQTDDLGGGVVQDLMKDFIAEETETKGGVSPEKSNWKLTYSGSLEEVEEVNLTGEVFGILTDALTDGDEILIYYLDGETCLTTAGTGRLDPTDAKAAGKMVATGTDAAVFTVKAEGDFFYLIADGKYLTSGATGNSLSMEETPNDYSLWYLKAVDGGVHIMNANAAYNGNKNQALEWYSGFTTYGEQDTSAYLFNIYSVTDCAVYSPDGVADGGKYLVYYEADGTIVSDSATGNKLEATKVSKDSGLIPRADDQTVFTVEFADETNFYLIADGKYLTSGATGNSLSMEETPNDYSLWYLKAVDGGYHVMSTNAAYNGTKNQALEWYSGFTTYGEKDTEIYLFNFYAVTDGTAADDCTDGHDWGEWVETKAATCTEQGEETRTCGRCGETETRKTDALGHDWDEGTVTKEATETETGEKTYTCNRCGETKTEELPKTECPSAKFTDVDTSKWYHEGVDFAVSNGYIRGITDTTFEPNTPMNRGMLVTILYRVAGEPDVADASIPFTDVAEGRYFTNAVKWAYSNNIVTGVTEKTFEPQTPVTREQLATILYRYAGAEEVAEDLLKDFPDSASVHKYAQKAMNWAVSAGLITGNKENGVVYLDPAGSATRAQIAVILMRYLTTVA